MNDHPLQIAFPDTTSTGLSVCDATPAALADWVAHLPMANTSEAAMQLLKVATDIARIQAVPELRFNFLEAVRPPAHYICARLDRTAAGASAAGEGHAQLAQSLQNELILGYKAVLRDLLAGAELTDTLRDLLGHAIHRATADLSCALLRTYEFYTDAPPQAWYELNQIYRLADELGIATSSYADEQSRGGGVLTITDAYLRIALLAAAKPNQLRQKDLSAVFNALDQWTPRIRIGAPADDTLFVVDLNADAPPSYRELGSHGGDALRGISTDVLVYELEAYLAEMASDVPVPDYVSPRPAAPPGPCVGHDEEALVPALAFVRHAEGLHRDANAALLHLRRRRVRRTARLHRSAAATRDQSLHRRTEHPTPPPSRTTSGTTGSARRIPVNPNISDPGRILLSTRRARSQSAIAANYPCYDTEIIDTSPSGYCARWPSPMPIQLQTGELLAIRERDDARWCVAVSRWIRHSDQETLMGIELLAPRAIPVAVRMLQKRGNSTDYNRAVLLPALDAIGQPAMLITPRLPYNESQKVQLRRHTIQATGQLMRRVLMTESFTQFTFRMLDGYLENTQIDLNMDSLWDAIGADQPKPSPKGSQDLPASGKKK